MHEPGEDDEWRDLYREIAGRYLPRESADEYVDDTIDQPRALLALPLAKEAARVTTWRMPMEDEDRTGIWASRYYLDGTQMAEQARAGTGAPAYRS